MCHVTFEEFVPMYEYGQPPDCLLYKDSHPHLLVNPVKVVRSQILSPSCGEDFSPQLRDKPVSDLETKLGVRYNVCGLKW